MWADRRRALSGKGRVREATLRKVLLLGGAFGVVAGMERYHRGTLKEPFADAAFAAAIAWAAALLGLQRVLGPAV